MTHRLSPLLEIKNLHKHYRLGQNQVSVLKGLSVSVAAGEMVVIMGPSGSGKTTLLNCIAGIDVPDKGTLTIKGEPVDFRSEKQRTLLRRHHIGIVFQFFNLIPTLTVRENISLPFLIAQTNNRSAEQRVDALLERIGLKKRETHYPFQLSGGEMQLVSIARALVHSPSILLADEPTGNVNPKVGRSIMDILRNTARQKNAAVVMVTHSPEHAAWADRICFLRNGVITSQYRQEGKKDDVAHIYEQLIKLEI